MRAQKVSHQWAPFTAAFSQRMELLLTSKVSIAAGMFSGDFRSSFYFISLFSFDFHACNDVVETQDDCMFCWMQWFFLTFYLFFMECPLDSYACYVRIDKYEKMKKNIITELLLVGCRQNQLTVESVIVMYNNCYQLY